MKIKMYLSTCVGVDTAKTTFPAHGTIVSLLTVKTSLSLVVSESLRMREMS